MSSPEQPAQAARPAAVPSESVESVESVESLIGETTVTVHRAPRYVNFMLLGGVIGAVAALVLTFAFPENPTFSRAQVFGFLLLAGATFGVALGALAAMVADRIVRRTQTTVVADRLGGYPSTPTTALTPGQDAGADPQHSGTDQRQ